MPIGEVAVQFSPESNFADVPVRCWFINPDDTQLIQVQNNCFIRNWRTTEQTPDYLHYDVIRPLFERDWSTFLTFLSEEQLAPPTVWQCEVAYVNNLFVVETGEASTTSSIYIQRGKEWSRKDCFLGPRWFRSPYPNALPKDKENLQFVSQPGIRKSVGTEIIQLTITALGKPVSSRGTDIMQWLNLEEQPWSGGLQNS